MTETAAVIDFNPVATDFRRALLALRDTVKDETWRVWVKLLKAHYAMPNHQITPAQLAEATGLSAPSQATLRYGNLAHAVADQLRFTPEKRARGNGRPMWWKALSNGPEGDDSSPNFELTMLPALADALLAMKWV
ncbi:MAG: hypothetical protein JNM18_07090 [Planctomycetaceae bacterium]|nr:hypothetical protein [Planctomycetaceae bacterium]